MGWWWPAAGLGALSVAVRAWDLLKEVTLIFITSTIVWPQVKQQGGEGNGTPFQYSCLENPWTEEHGGFQSMGQLRVDRTEVT